MCEQGGFRTSRALQCNPAGIPIVAYTRSWEIASV